MLHKVYLDLRQPHRGTISMCQCCDKKTVNLKTGKISSIRVIVRVSDCPQKRTPEKRLQIAELVSHDQ